VPREVEGGPRQGGERRDEEAGAYVPLTPEIADEIRSGARSL
jgi:hypothetical protein